MCGKIVWKNCVENGVESCVENLGVKSVPWKVYSVQCTVYSVQCAVYNVQ